MNCLQLVSNLVGREKSLLFNSVRIIFNELESVYDTFLVGGDKMKAIMIMFDSLNKHFLPCYGNEWIKAPNFERLAKKTVTFDKFYAGSLPCMPARRELHTGRLNFLHRSWGPLEPFDVSMPNLLKEAGIYTHLITDHFHYFEDGGSTYHNRYNTWEMVRGQQGDPYVGMVNNPEIPACQNPRKINLDNWRQDWVNRKVIDTEDKQPMPITFNMGLDFIDRNKDEDNWFLQLETFDPHEPFYTMEHYKELYPHLYEGEHYDWPNYGKVDDDDDTKEHLKLQYAALISMCDAYLGKVLDKMDELNLWEDTMLIVNTDHGFMLGEKQWYGKNIQPFYNEIVNLPFFIYDPSSKEEGTRREALAQTIDIAPTLLDHFNQPIPKVMQGKSLRPVIKEDAVIRETALFGMHGGHVNITDGHHVYMRANTTKDNGPLNEYTLMPTHMREMFTTDELQQIEMIDKDSFNFIPCKAMKIKTSSFLSPDMHGHLLYDLKSDPKQLKPLDDKILELKMAKKMMVAMHENDAPKEQYLRLGYEKGMSMSVDDLSAVMACEEISIDAPLQLLLDDPITLEILKKYLGPFLENPMLDMAKALSLPKLSQLSKGQLPMSVVEMIGLELDKIS